MHTIVLSLGILDFLVFSVIPFVLSILITMLPVLGIKFGLTGVYKLSKIGSFLLSLLLFLLLLLPIIYDPFIDKNIGFSMYRLFNQLDSRTFINAYIVSLFSFGLYALAGPLHLYSLNKVEKGTCVK